jgi:hypothetical protein
LGLQEKSSAEKAFQAINGRHFDGRVIVASYATAEYYDELSS